MKELPLNTRSLQKSYELNGIVYVQRCVNGNFVAPGFPDNDEITESKLIDAGAKLRMRYGWERGYVPRKADLGLDIAQS